MESSNTTHSLLSGRGVEISRMCRTKTLSDRWTLIGRLCLVEGRACHIAIWRGRRKKYRLSRGKLSCEPCLRGLVKLVVKRHLLRSTVFHCRCGWMLFKGDTQSSPCCSVLILSPNHQHHVVVNRLTKLVFPQSDQ